MKSITYKRRTHDSISKERQVLSQEIDAWKAGIKSAETCLLLDSVSREQAKQKVEFCKAQLIECRKRMCILNRSGKGKRAFWPHSRN